MTEINGAEIEAVDVITFGSPCQDLSVAGKRAGLKHSANGDDETTRSGLFMEAVRIIKEMREATNGEYPKYAIWENVMGAFSSNAGEDFRIVLEEFIKIVEPEAPPIPSPGKAGWPYADCIVGDGWSLAWRTFDAQHWGVAQRRRRLYALLDLTSGRAEKVLFEREGLRGYFEKGISPWQGAAGDPQGSPGADYTESGIIPYTLKIRSGCEGGGKGALIQEDMSATLATNNDQYLFQPIAVATQQGGAEISEDGICPTVTAAAGMSGNNQPWVCCRKEKERCQKAAAYSISSYDSNAMKSSNPHAGIYEATTSRTLDLNGGYPATNQGGIVIIDQIAGQGEYYTESTVSSTLRAGGLGAVCYDARGNGDGGIAPTITGDHNNRVTDYTALCMTTGNYMQVAEEVSPTIMARDYKDPSVVSYPGMASGKDTTGCLMASGYEKLGGQEMFSGDYTVIEEPQECQYIVRRLTPTECARLQGFPDRWGDIPHKETFTDEEYSFWLNVRNTHAEINGRTTKDYTKEQMLKWYNKLHSDSSEYKMWGNGIALPNALYVMQGIAEVNSHGRN